MHWHCDIPLRSGMPEQRMQVVSVKYIYLPKKLIGHHSNIPWATTEWISDLSSSPIGRICQFLPYFWHRYTDEQQDLQSYWTGVHQIFTWHSQVIAAVKVLSNSVICQYISECQSDKWRPLADSAPKIGCTAMPLDRSEKGQINNMRRYI